MSAQEKEQDQGQNYDQGFSADVSRLLDIVANALYTNHDIFLRELISNSADACDRLRYDAISTPELTKDNPDFRICVYKDTTNRTVTVVDNGVGMDDAELADNLGTIAKSGTAALMEQLKGSKGETGDKLKLIGQFGVGFYAGFMVAHKIEVVSRKAGSDKIFTWESDGASGFIVREANDIEAARLDGERGTVITLYIKDEACEFLIDQKIEDTVKQYSDHIAVPIYLGAPSMVSEDSEAEPLNNSAALWMRSPSEITEKDYIDFYTHIGQTIDEPVMTCHWHAEGKIDFTALLFIPTLRPWDLFDPSRKRFVKLYIRRVFITDELDGLMFPWLRFVRGIIDSEDLPLNISRETLQYNPVVEKIRNAVARKILGDLDKLSRNDEPAFITFWAQFGAAIKEGLYDAAEHQAAILKICRFYSSNENSASLTSFEEYVERMKDGQDKIYYLSGENLESVKNSPQLEGFRSRGIEVLYFTDAIDDFWLQSVLDYKGHQFQSITRGDVDFDKFDGDKAEDAESDNTESKDSSKDIHALITAMQGALEGKVHNVRKSKRLKDSPVCLVASDEAVDMHMERVLKVNQKYNANTKPVLEINPDHALIQKLAAKAATEDDIKDFALLLLDQAHIIQGNELENPTDFARRMSEIMKDIL